MLLAQIPDALAVVEDEPEQSLPLVLVAELAEGVVRAVPRGGELLAGQRRAALLELGEQVAEDGMRDGPSSLGTR